MKDVRDNAFSFLDDWYGRLDDIIDDLKEHGFDVLNATAEWIDVSDTDDKEYVIKLDGTKRTITIKSIEALNESNKTLTEGGIYPVDLDKEHAIDALEDKLSQILNGGVQVKNLEVLPSYGFGGAGVYWYKCDIDLYDEIVVNLLDKKLTPIAYNANENNNLIIYLPSVRVDCSYSDEYTLYIDLDSRNESDNYDKLKEEEKYIENKIVELLKNNKDELIELLKDYELDEELDESLIPIQEYWDEDEWDDDELANIYGGDTSQSQKDIAEDEIAALKSEAFDDWKEPKLGKKIKQLKGWKIYQGTDSSGDEVFRCFTPDDYRPEVGYEDWECETLEQAISWIQNYDLEESTKTNKENIKDDSKKVLEDDSSEENDEMIVIEYVTSGNDETDIQRRLDRINKLILSYGESGNDGFFTLVDDLEDEVEDLRDIRMKLMHQSKDDKIVTEQDTFGNYEENVFTALDNIEMLVSSYEELNADSLKTLISRLEDEVDTLKKINMKLITGIKQYTL